MGFLKKIVKKTVSGRSLRRVMEGRGSIADPLGLRSKVKGEDNLTLANMYRQQLADFDRYEKPIIDALKAEAKSTRIRDRAIKSASQLYGNVQGMTERRLLLTGEDLLPSQRKAMDKDVANRSKLASGLMVTKGYADQRANNTAARYRLMSIADNLQTTGVSGAAQVEAQFRQRQEQARAGNAGMLGNVLGIAGTVVGGVFGGPAGAAIGGSIGQAVGQGVGGG